MAARKSKSKEIATWDEELAKYAELAVKMEANVGGGSFFSVKGGILSWNDNPIQDNEMIVIVLDSVMENVFFDGVYDPEVITPPTCFAFGRDEKEMRPHDVVVEADQAFSDQCEGCELNEWGSADVGKGKACRNTRRLAMIAAASKDGDEFELFEDAKHFDAATIGYMKPPVTSVVGYASFVKQVAGALKRPPFGIYTRVKVVPDAKTQFKVVFEPVEKVGDQLMEAIMARVEEAKSGIEQPYSIEVDEAPPPKKKPAAKKKATKKVVKKKPAAKKKAEPASEKKPVRRNRKY